MLPMLHLSVYPYINGIQIVLGNCHSATCMELLCISQNYMDILLFADHEIKRFNIVKALEYIYITRSGCVYIDLFL